MDIHILWSILIFHLLYEESRCQCSKQDYQRCVKMADPLLKDPHLIYPDNPKDIEHVCRTWTYFVECVKDYTDRCFTEAKRKEFNKAVESPVSSIHKLCSSPEYRNEYMKHAGCMKMMLTEDNHCGRHYRLLVSQVSGEAAQASVCCSHHMFRECVVDQTRSSCDTQAAPFSSQMLDKALSFLRDQCSTYIPNHVDCPGLEFYKSTTKGRSEEDDVIKTTKVAGMTTTGADRGQTGTTTQMRPIQTQEGGSKTTQPHLTKTTNPWTTQPDSRGSSSSKSQWGSSLPWTPAQSTESDATRYSFGRGMSWGSSMETTPSWRVTSGSGSWLPSPRPMDNAIDEPNQQGLGSSVDNSAFILTVPLLLIIALLLPPLAAR